MHKHQCQPCSHAMMQSLFRYHNQPPTCLCTTHRFQPLPKYRCSKMPPCRFPLNNPEVLYSLHSHLSKMHSRKLHNFFHDSLPAKLTRNRFRYTLPSNKHCHLRRKHIRFDPSKDCFFCLLLSRRNKQHIHDR